LVPVGLFLFFALLYLRITASHARLASLATELPERGVRRAGRVRDALPYAPDDGGAVFDEDGALMVLQVELAEDERRPREVVQLHVVEDTERARARIGTEVIVMEHPSAKKLRALKGYLPDGRRLN
jgi:hypothetical protein